MKAHMRRKQEELDAKNAQNRQIGRQQARSPAAPATPAAPETVANPADLPAVWSAARRWLGANAGYLERVLGHCCSITALDPQTGEATLLVPAVQRGFTSERARVKIEEALRAVTKLPLKLALQISEAAAPPPPGPTNAPAASAPRVPPEIVEAVKAQPLIKELMKRLDATVVQIELLGAGDAD